MEIIIQPLLWTYDVLKNGEYAIQIRVTYYKDVKYISTGYSSLKNDWDIKNNCPYSSHPDFKAVIKKLQELSDEIIFQFHFAKRNGIENISMETIKQSVLKKDVRKVQVKLFEFLDSHIEKLENAERIGYANVFKNCRASLKKVFQKDKAFAAFTKSDFEKYESFIIRTVPKESTISHYLRTFYRLWNIAIKEGLCPAQLHPSKFIQTKPYKKIRTKKRAITSDFIKAIENLSFDYNTRMFRSQQYFLFSYYARGINFNDMAKLKYNSNLKGNNILYIRSKNKREYDYVLHSKATKIIEILKNYPLQSNAGYIFPILGSQHNTAKKIDARIDSALKDLNEDLRQMGEIIGLPKTLTSYVARHSFATNLRKKKVDLDIIQEAMGHETAEQTATYLEEIDDTIVAESIELALD